MYVAPPQVVSVAVGKHNVDPTGRPAVSLRSTSASRNINRLPLPRLRSHDTIATPVPPRQDTPFAVLVHQPHVLRTLRPTASTRHIVSLSLPSVHPSIRPSIRPSIHPSIHSSIHSSIHPNPHANTPTHTRPPGNNNNNNNDDDDDDSTAQHSAAIRATSPSSPAEKGAR